jgi:hypothetical protein
MKTKEYYIKKHREMWNWLAENPNKKKEHWPGWELIGYIENNCFLCGYIFQSGDGLCKNCPLDWVITETCMGRGSEMSYYRSYELATILRQRSGYAKIIANLPEKKEI